MGNGDSLEENKTEAGIRQWVALVVLIFPVLLVTVDAMVMLYAMPKITAELNPSAPEQLWMIDIYAFILAGLLITMGNLGDRVGRKKLLMIGSAGFGLASILAASATTPLLLILARAFLGIAGATLMPSTLSLLRSTFRDDVQRRVAIAVWSAAASGGAAFGPIVGGFLLEHFFWGAVFLINVPVIVALLIFGPFILRESKDPNPGPFDLLSSLMSFTAILPLIYAVKIFAEHGFSMDVTVALIIGISSLALFIRRQKRLTQPMIDINLFRNRIFSGSVIINMLSVFGLMGSFYILTQHLQSVWDLSPMAAALWLLPAAVAESLSALAAIWVARVLPLNRAVALGLFIVALGVTFVFLIGVETSPIVLTVGAVVLASGSGTAYALSNDAIIASVQEEKAGAAAAVSETAYELGGALGIAILGTILSLGYRTFLALPADTPGHLANSVRQSLGNALNALNDSAITPVLGDEITEAVRSAFIRGEVLVGIVVVLLLSVAVAIAWVLLKDVKGKEE